MGGSENKRLRKLIMPGVQHITINQEDEGLRLDRWFKRYFPSFSHIALEKALRKGDIRIDKKRAKSNTRLNTGQIVRIPPFDENKQQAPQKNNDKLLKYKDIILKSVIYKDTDIIAINKPAGLAVQGGSGVKICLDDMLDFLKFNYEEKPKLVHRLDKDTSGVLLIARKASSAAKITEAFRQKKTQKTYLAILAGVPNQTEGKIISKIAKENSGAGKEKVRSTENGKNAITYFKVIDKVGNTCCLVELTPITGRTHQLRVHMAEAGTPILGDGKYGGKQAFIQDVNNMLHLHARKIIVTPKDKPIEIKADLPNHMRKTMNFLGLSI